METGHSGENLELVQRVVMVDLDDVSEPAPIPRLVEMADLVLDKGKIQRLVTTGLVLVRRLASLKGN